MCVCSFGCRQQGGSLINLNCNEMASHCNAVSASSTARWRRQQQQQHPVHAMMWATCRDTLSECTAEGKAGCTWWLAEARLTASKLFPVMMLPVAPPSPTVCNSSSGVWLQSRLRVGLPAAWCHRAHRGRHASHPKALVLLRFQNARRRWPVTKMVQCVQQGRIDCAAICPPCPPSLALLLAQPHFLTVLPTLRHSAHAARSLTYMLGFQTSEVAKHRLLYNFCRSGCYFT